MHRLRSSIAWLTLVAGASAAACTFDLREEPVQGPVTATEPGDDEASAADAGSGSTTGSNAKADGGDAGVTVTCYADEDGDGYPDSASSITASGSCPAPYVPTPVYKDGLLLRALTRGNGVRAAGNSWGRAIFARDEPHPRRRTAILGE